MKSIGKNIKHIRKEKKMTQKELGIKTGFTQVYISKIENNEFVPKINSLIKLSKALECSINDLLNIYDDTA